MNYSVIVVLLISLFGSLYGLNKSKGNEEKQANTIVELQKKVNDYKDQVIAAQAKAKSVSDEYESLKAEREKKAEVINHEIEKIVDRPIYIHDCFDDDGLSAIKSKIKLANQSN